MREPTAEEALEWLAENGVAHSFARQKDRWVYWTEGVKFVTGPTPLEAIRNAMKGEG